MSRGVVVLAFLACVALPLRAGDAETILLDSVHAHNHIERGLSPGVYDYHELHGPRRALHELQARGAKLTEVRSGRVDTEVLSGTDVLYLNLVSSDLPAFFPGEIASIRSFVTRGGALLLITDHSNCYHHVNELEPLAEALELRLFKESALEVAPRALGSGPGWIVVDHFEKHPITTGLRWISFQTGGPVDDRGAVATLSKGGWGDRWATSPFGENALRSGNLGNYGNFELDKDERKGRLAVVSARRLGKGRIVVVGDQNVFGDVWIRYGDNRRLFHNVMSWLANGGVGALPAPTTSPRVLLLEDRARMAFGSDAPSGLFNAFVALARHVDTFAHTVIDGAFDLVVVAPRETALSASVRAKLVAHLKRGGSVLWLGRNGEAGETGAAQLSALRAAAGEAAAQRVVGAFDAEGFTNRALASPTSRPNPQQQKVEDAWLKRIRDLLR